MGLPSTSVMTMQERSYLHGNTYTKMQLVMVKISMNIDELYQREVRELNSVKSTRHFCKVSNRGDP